MPLPMRQARMHPPMAPMGPMHHWISRRLPTDRGIRCISVVPRRHDCYYCAQQTMYLPYLPPYIDDIVRGQNGTRINRIQLHR